MAPHLKLYIHTCIKVKLMSVMLLTIINLQSDFHLFFALDAVRTLSQHLVALLVPLPQLTELNADPRVIRAWGWSLLGGCAGAECGHDAAEG